MMIATCGLCDLVSRNLEAHVRRNHVDPRGGAGRVEAALAAEREARRASNLRWAEAEKGC